MNKKKIKYVNDRYAELPIEENLEIAIKKLQALLSSATAETWKNLKLIALTEYDYEDANTRLVIRGERPQTKDEARIEAEFQIKIDAREKEFELKQLAELKAKYEK